MNVQARRKFIGIAKRRVKSGSGSTTLFLTTRTWANPVTNLSSLITVPYVIVGGVATRLYMPDQMTLGLDILIHHSQADRLYQDLITKAILIGELSIGRTLWELPDKTVLNILTEDLPWVNQALVKPKMSLDGQPIIDLPYLVLMKLATSRTTDISDISRMLGQANDRDLDRVRDTIKLYDRESLEDLESLIQLGKLEFES